MTSRVANAAPTVSAHQPCASRGAGTSGAASVGLALGAQIAGLLLHNQERVRKYCTTTATIAPPKVQATNGHNWFPSVTRLNQSWDFIAVS